MKRIAVRLAFPVLVACYGTAAAQPVSFTIDPAASHLAFASPLTGALSATYDPFAMSLTFAGGSTIHATGDPFHGILPASTFTGSGFEIRVLSGSFDVDFSPIQLDIVGGTVLDGASASLLQWSATGSALVSGSANVRVEVLGIPQTGTVTATGTVLTDPIFTPSGPGTVQLQNGPSGALLGLPFDFPVDVQGVDVEMTGFGVLGSIAEIVVDFMQNFFAGQILSQFAGAPSFISATTAEPLPAPPPVHWTKGASGSWQEAGAWTPALSPGAGHDVRIDPNVSVTVTGPAADTAVNTLEIGGGQGIATLSVLGGTITTTGDRAKVRANGILTGDGTVAGGVLNEGRIVAQNLTIEGGVENQGVITGNGRLNADISNTTGSIRVGFGQSLQIGGSVANAATGNVEVFNGELEVSGAFSNAGRFATHHSVLRFGGGLANTGQVLVGAGTADVFGSVQNLAGGQVIVSGMGGAIFYDDVVNSGEMRASAASSIVYFGTLSGSGALTGEGMHFVEGTLGPGSSPGVMNAVNLTLGALSELEIELFGTEPVTEYDRLVVSGDLALNGTLSVLLGGGFSPLAGTSFDILDWGTLAGEFHTLVLPGLGPLLAWNTSLLYEDGTISVAAIPEPQTYALLLTGLVLLGFAARRSNS